MSYNSGTLITGAFTGRAISKILVHPTDPATIFVSTSTGIAGIGANSFSNTVPPLGIRGVYRSTNATAVAASVTFQKLAVSTGASLDSPPTGNRSITDMVFVNGDPNTMVVGVFGTAAGNDGGIFRSTNALAATPAFTHTFVAQIDRISFAVNGNTVLAATDENVSFDDGRLRRSTDGGATWPTILTAADGFCGGQCFYDIVVGIDPQNAARIYLGGSARGSGLGGAEGMQVSTDGGTGSRATTTASTPTRMRSSSTFRLRPLPRPCGSETTAASGSETRPPRPGHCGPTSTMLSARCSSRASPSANRTPPSRSAGRRTTAPRSSRPVSATGPTPTSVTAGSRSSTRARPARAT